MAYVFTNDIYILEMELDGSIRLILRIYLSQACYRPNRNASLSRRIGYTRMASTLLTTSTTG